MTQSDAELIEEILAGNKDAYALLVQRWERSVRAAAMSIVKKPHIADDAAQDAFVRAWEQLPTLRNPKVFGFWLIQITRRCALNSLRKQHAIVSSDGLYQLPAHEKNGELDEQNQYLLETISKLPQPEQQVVMLRYFGPHTVNELAAVLNRSVGTVTKQLSRAHRRIKRHMQEFDK